MKSYDTLVENQSCAGGRNLSSRKKQKIALSELQLLLLPLPPLLQWCIYWSGASSRFARNGNIVLVYCKSLTQQFPVLFCSIRSFCFFLTIFVMRTWMWLLLLIMFFYFSGRNERGKKMTTNKKMGERKNRHWLRKKREKHKHNKTKQPQQKQPN